MAAIEITYAESSFARLVPAILTSGKISSLGTEIDLLRSTKVTPKFVSPNSTGETQYHTVDGSNGNQYSTPDISKNYNVISGVEISDGTGADANESFAIEAFVTPAQRKTLIDAFRAGTPLIASRDIGKNATTEAVAGYEYLLGKITEYTESSGSGPLKITFSITADPTITFKTTSDIPDVDETDYNTIATGAGNTITPDNEPELTITALTTPDWANLVLGKIVTKNAS